MAEGLSPTPTTPHRETEPERLTRVRGMYPEPLQRFARALLDNVPGLEEVASGNPHIPIQNAVGRIRDAIRPPQS